MLCAHTVRRLKPGRFDQFSEAFLPRDDEAPPGWVRFHLLRSLADPNEVVTFGFFDGTLEQLEASQRDADFESRRDSIASFVDVVIANGVYEIAVSRVLDDAAPA
jgi:heme-degrading monooxygenase HmoA